MLIAIFQAHLSNIHILSTGIILLPAGQIASFASMSKSPFSVLRCEGQQRQLRLGFEV